MLTAVNTLEVFIKSREIIYRIAFLRTGTKQAAQDITQDICLKVMSLANEFPTCDDARNYLIRITINASTDYVRTEKRHRRLLEGAFVLFEDYDGASPEVECQQAEDISQIDKALESLPSKCRDILYLNRIEGMTHAEIAVKLGVSLSLVEKYAIRALLHCRQHLNKK